MYRFVGVATVVAVLTGCSSLDQVKASVKEGLKDPLGKVQPYTLDIPQGNLITQEMVDKLKPGMTRSQVRFVLGTPLVVDPFHAQRWDFVYSLRKSGAVIESRRMTALFEGDLFKAIEGDVVVSKPATPIVTTTPAVQP